MTGDIPPFPFWPTTLVSFKRRSLLFRSFTELSRLRALLWSTHSASPNPSFSILNSQSSRSRFFPMTLRSHWYSPAELWNEQLSYLSLFTLSSAPNIMRKCMYIWYILPTTYAGKTSANVMLCIHTVITSQLIKSTYHIGWLFIFTLSFESLPLSTLTGVLVYNHLSFKYSNNDKHFS